MADKIYSFLDKHNVLDAFQHGFRKAHSMESAVTKIIQHIKDKIEKNEYVVLVSFDLSRAFQTLHPMFLSEKIASMGCVNGWLMSW